jgi:hypothetical protein
MLKIDNRATFTKDQNKRYKFLTQEIFFNTCSLIIDSKLTNDLNFFLFRRNEKARFLTKLKNRCLLSKKYSVSHAKLRLSRFGLNKGASCGLLNGFFHAV